MNKQANSPDYNQAMEPALEDPRPVVEKPKKKSLSKKLKTWIWIAIAILLIFFTPWRINILLLGIDPSHDQTNNSRTDTIILTSIPPILPETHMISIPRDLYVDIPGHGQNRINTAHFFAEVDKPGSGPAATARAVAMNFHIARPSTVRINLNGVESVVEAMGGVDLDLPTRLYGLDPGIHHLDAAQTIKFLRDRSESDDFSRQKRAQVFLQGAARKMLSPVNWWRIPAVVKAISQTIDINVPILYWPRIGYSLLFSAIRGWDMQVWDRYTMSSPWTTEGGAQVLLPNWDAINPVLDKYFR